MSTKQVINNWVVGKERERIMEFSQLQKDDVSYINTAKYKNMGGLY